MTPPATMTLIGNIRYDDAKVKICNRKTFFYPLKGASGFLVKFSIKIQVMLILNLFLYLVAGSISHCVGPLVCRSGGWSRLCFFGVFGTLRSVFASLLLPM